MKISKSVSVHFFELPTEQKDAFKLNKGSGWVKTGDFDPKSKADDINESFFYTPGFGYETWPL